MPSPSNVSEMSKLHGPKGRESVAQAKAHKANLMRGPSMGEWLLSQRDRLIVARHEVPGKRPLKEPSRRVRYDRAQLIPHPTVEALIKLALMG
jgi:hypothetical protein